MPIRIIHIGTGSRGRHWLEIVRDYQDAVSVAFVDRDPRSVEEAKKLAGNSQAKFYTDLDVALREVPADAALIATPSFLHAEHARRALQSGLALLIEKPFATNLKDAAEVIQTAKGVGKPVVVAENYRFFAAERTVRRWIAEDRLGRIATVTCVDRRNQPLSDQGPWVADLDYPQLAEIAVHHFDSFRYLFHRNPLNIMARAFNPPGSHYRSGAATEALIEMEEGLPILYFGSLTSHRYEYSLWIEGEKGSLWTDRKRVWWRKKGWRFFIPVRLVSVPKGDELPYPRAGTTSLLNQLRDAVLHNQEPETSAQDNFWSLAMVAAAMRSADEGRKVAVAEVVSFLPPSEGERPSAPGDPSTNGDSPAPRETAMSVSGNSPRARTLVIGWDAADAELIEQWCAEGLLPNIARMRSQGSWARMRTTAEFLHVSAWPSIFTGTAPDKHGLYHAYVMRPGQQSPLRPQPDMSPFPFLWKQLSDHGKRCVIIDAFLTCPLDNLNGSQIVDWGSWSHFWPTTILPAALKREMEKKFGSYPAEDHSKVGMAPPSDYQGFHQRLLAAVEKKTQVVKWLMEKEDWDLFLAVFSESHPAGHYFWHFHDSSYAAHPREGAGALQHALRDVYVALDKALGEILRQTDERTTVFVVSGDGMGPNYSGSHILMNLLTRMALLNNNAGQGAAANKSKETTKSGKAKSDLLSAIRNMIPKSIRVGVSQALLPRYINEKLSLRWKTSGITWNQTRAFLIENANEGYIRINLKGREPQGTVAPGREYESLCEQIYETARGMVNPANGRRAARSVYKSDDIYHGPCRSHMPDIIIHWNDEAKITTELLTEKYGLVCSQAAGWAVTPYYTGNHRPNAFAVVAGSDVPKGALLDGVTVLDLAPTILTRHGIEPPDYMDGKVLDSLSGRNRVEAPAGAAL
jgi:predicted dehydrogenase/predicted AlkP superfamily phosphohydrolase/phosphomutase